MGARIRRTTCASLSRIALVRMIEDLQSHRDSVAKSFSALDWRPAFRQRFHQFVVRKI